MPSPFPGMDPYLEQPDFWSEVHNRLIVAIADCLVSQVRPKYRVAIEKRIYRVDPENDDNNLLVGIPDVTVKRQPSDPDKPIKGVATVLPGRQPVTVTLPLPERVKQAYLEVRDLATGQVVTALEILSPVNKRPGEGREIYLKKRNRVLGSLTHWVEIDLLPDWEPMPMYGSSIRSDYRVIVSQAASRPKADLYGFGVRESLPSFPIPLRPKDSAAIVDLQQILSEVYDRAGYDYIIDYAIAPIPPLAAEDAAWANDRLREKGFRL
ncbi:DUF4058 family protein [Lusitaniella coriacea LEGE 07157]|uniref:DUF4058 family protein n=1 Tax=Lusitaniella coriacea LEGE 07157 TaxID=945747 RepID=A0A8J7DZY5_9CYAN|nr:DUF4058 family protein [Lusitaniella coriacea]MBE9116861.1 DUF4058 family protein [Lusitaniella coriacea LEGE 07157]